VIDFTRRDTFDRLAVLTGLYSPDASLIETRGAAPVSVRGSKENRIFAAHPGHLKIIDALFAGHRYIQMTCGVRWGKTFFQPSVYGFMQQHKNIWIVTPTYDLGHQNLEYTLESLDKIPWIRGKWKYLKGEKTIVANQKSWGSRIKFKSAEKLTSLDAEPVDLVEWDEAAKCRPQVKQKILARILEREGTIIGKSTPVGHNFYYDMHEDPLWYSLQSSTYDNPFIANSVIDDLKKMMDPQSFKQDIMAQFVVFAGQVYYMFDPDRHLIDPGDIDLNGWEIVLLADPGFSDPCALTWFAHNKINQEDVIIRSMLLYGAKNEMENVNRLINKFEPEHGYEAYVCDPYGGDQGNQQTRKSFRDWFKHEGEDSNGNGIYFHGVRSGKIKRILNAKGRFQNVNGDIRLRILNVPETHSIIRAVENYHYPEGINDKQVLPVHDNNSHECDNIANYVAWRYRRVTTRSQAV